MLEIGLVSELLLTDDLCARTCRAIEARKVRLRCIMNFGYYPAKEQPSLAGNVLLFLLLASFPATTLLPKILPSLAIRCPLYNS